jgi:hypothetical protein
MLGDQFGDFILRIVQVAEDPRSGRTDLDTGRFQTGIDPMVAKVALLNDWHKRVHISGIVGTRGKTVFTANTSMFINDHDPVFPLPCGLDRTIDDTGRVVALVAKGGEEMARDIGVLPLFDDLHPRPENP